MTRDDGIHLVLMRRQALKLFGASAAAVGLAACVPATTAPAPTSGTNPTGGAGAAAGKAGGTLKVAYVGDMATGLQSVYATDAGFGSAVGNVFDKLVVYDEQRMPQPMLAESWDLSSDQQTIKVSVRKGVQYHTGRELSAADVAWNLNRVKTFSAGDGALFAPFAKNITEIQTPDASTVVVKLDRPRYALFDFLAYLSIADPMSPPSAENKGMVVGTGPFTFVEWVPGDHVTLAKNKNYWRSGRPYLDMVTYQVVRDAQTAAVQIESGAADMANPLAYTDIARLLKDSKFQTVKPAIQPIMNILLNVTKSPTNNKLFRQALSYSLDRKRIAEQAYQGLGELRVLPWSADQPAYDAGKNSQYAFDLDKTKSLIQQSGITERELDMVNFPGAGYEIAGPIWQADLATAGIKLNLKMTDQPSANALTVDPNNDWRIAGSRTSQVAQDPSLILVGLTYGETPPGQTGFKDEQFAQLVDSVSAEFDPGKRKALFGQINDILLDEQFALTVAGGGRTATQRSYVNGTGYVNGLRYDDVWLDK